VTTERARCVVSDPPWSFRDSCPGDGRGAVKHYRCMSVAEMRRYHERILLRHVAETAWLFLWRVAAMQWEALTLVSLLGFEVKSEIVWVKTKDPARKKLQIGMGRYTRNAHETCLICSRGKSPSRLRLSASEDSLVFAPRTEHSRKPDAFFEKVEKLCPGPRLELFARQRRDGWRQMGDELK
jgi:N6-adenosine-specific RNA methylase IME4